MSAMHDKMPAPDTVTSNVSRLKNMFQVEDAAARLASRNVDPKRKRSSAEPERSVKSSRSPDPLDSAAIDPQKFFETTNHVQRFQYTRSLFAKMEQESAQHSTTRNKSPARSSVSPARSPSYDSRTNARYRAGSVENIVDEQTYNRRYRHLSTDEVSRSETDLSRDRSGSDVVVTTAAAPPRALIEQYENKTGQEQKPQQPQQQQQQPQQFQQQQQNPPQQQQQQSYQHKSRNTPVSAAPPPTQEVAQQQHHSRSYTRGRDDTRSRPDSASADNDIVERWRNRYNRDKHTEHNSSGGGALLWKRRSQDDSGISKEEIEACLSNADNYFKQLDGDTSEVIDSKMTESTYSSGSGEEMAQNSQHLITSPESPTTPTNDFAQQASWAARYTMGQKVDKPPISPKPDLLRSSEEPPSYSAASQGLLTGAAGEIQLGSDDSEPDYVDIPAPTPMDSLSKRKPR